MNISKRFLWNNIRIFCLSRYSIQHMVILKANTSYCLELFTLWHGKSDTPLAINYSIAYKVVWKIFKSGTLKRKHFCAFQNQISIIGLQFLELIRTVYRYYENYNQYLYFTIDLIGLHSVSTPILRHGIKQIFEEFKPQTE